MAQPTIASADQVAIDLHVAAIRVLEIANGVGYLARRYADRITPEQKAELEDAEASLREVAGDLTAKAEAHR